MRASSYAKALYALAQARGAADETLLRHFVRTVAGNGHAHLFPKIVRSLERHVEREREKETITVSSARELSPADVSSLLRKEPFKHALSPRHHRIERRTDPGLITGTVVRTGTMRIDASGKRALADLYQSLISR